MNRLIAALATLLLAAGVHAATVEDHSATAHGVQLHYLQAGAGPDTPVKAFEQDAADFAGFARTPLRQPMLVLSGEKASGTFLIEQARLVGAQVEGVVIQGSGHWLMEEAPAETIPRLLGFLNRR
jgi:pimeloyl-ACP methyl ester carboxylesterase